MATLTISLSDDKHECLRQLAERRKIVALVEFDAETRFRARAAMGSREEGLALLSLLDRED
jgi:hypothetical protein